ncbi:MAG: hypothetical protein RJA70_3794 [Pseudomonadota bacterium]|jgi:hypothetical protein
MKSWFTDRRTFLRGAGSIAIGLPFLNAMFTPEQARAQALRRRFILFNENNGNLGEVWRPKGGLTDFQLGVLHASLEPFRQYLLPIAGLHNPGGPGSDSQGVHAPGMATIATGGRLTTGGKWGTEQQVLAEGTGISDPTNYSIDQRICADPAYQGLLAARFQSYQFGVQVSDIPAASARVSYKYTEQPRFIKGTVPQFDGTHVESNPQRAFQDLFGALPTGQETPGGGANAEEQLAAAKRQIAKRGSVLDYVDQSYTSLKLRVGVDDQKALDDHLALIRKLELQVASIPGTVADSASLKCNAPDGAALPSGRGCIEEEQGTNQGPNNVAGCTGDLFEPIGKAQMDLLVTAFKCDLVRVGTMQWSMAGNRVGFAHIGADGGTHHDLSHRQDAKLVTIHTWYATMMAYLLGELQKATEPDGSNLLDNTGIAWVNELGKGAGHTHDDIPFMLLGKAAGAFNPGRFLDGSGRTNLDVWVQVLNAYGIPVDYFGDPDRGRKEGWLSGPLVEIS